MSTPGQSALCVNPTTGGAVAETTRALLVAMDQWVDRGVEPPPSNYPTLADRGRERDRGDEDDMMMMTTMTTANVGTATTATVVATVSTTQRRLSRCRRQANSSPLFPA